MNLNQRSINNSQYKHGGRFTRLYNIWSLMKARCLNFNNPSYLNYGGRGITICTEWLEFIPFKDWALSNGYTDNLTINRIENDGNYEPSNCNWITCKEQQKNKRKAKTEILNLEIANEIRILHKTGKYAQKELAEKYNVNFRTISYIINNKIWKY